MRKSVDWDCAVVRAGDIFKHQNGGFRFVIYIEMVTLIYSIVVFLLTQREREKLE